MPKSKISRDDVERFIEALREKLGTRLSNLTSVDDAIREAAEKCFDVREITVNRIRGI